MAYEFLLDPLIKYYKYCGKFPLEVRGKKRGGEWRHSTIQQAKELEILLPTFDNLVKTFGSYEKAKEVSRKVLERSPERGKIPELSEKLKEQLLKDFNRFYDEYRRYPKEGRSNGWPGAEQLLATQIEVELLPCATYQRYFGTLVKARDAALRYRMKNNMVIYCGSQQLAITW